MTTLLNRYPGAQPFPDTELSRRTFFGREQESIALTDQILANRLVVVYAKSGTGKSSLLNAGVAPRLREADGLPLMVRLNSTSGGLLQSVHERIREEAARQQVEYVPGDSSSLWAFFKTTEFWRGDLLLKPVLVLDQFEELFTLWGEEERDQFLSELNFVIRGIAPPGVGETYSHTPPTAHVVLSLREDFLGILEEASDRIPQIMDRRFRVAGLTVSAAKKAITGPAEVEAPNVATKPFHLDPDFVDAVMEYLTKATSGRRVSAHAQIEPFHLQLICQRIEKVAALKQQTSSEQALLTSKDFGGISTFSVTLANFYEDSIGALPNRRSRSIARRLCEQYLISPEGRRLSLEERELQRQLGLSQQALCELVDRRLLRTDRRSECTYYELSHDLLVEPVLASRRMQAIVLSWATIIAGAVIALVAAALLALLPFLTYGAFSSGEDWNGFALLATVAIVATMLIALEMLGVFWLRSGARRRRRYSPRAHSELLQPLPVRPGLKHRIWVWIALVAASCLFAVITVFSLYYLAICLLVAFGKSDVPSWMQDVVDHPWVEVPSTVAQLFSLLVLGWVSLRKSIRMLWPYEFPSPSTSPGMLGLFRRPSFAIISLKLILGGYALIQTGLSGFAFGSCVSVWHGHIPDALQAIISFDVVDACIAARAHEWDSEATITPIFWILALIGSVILIHSGLSDLRNIRWIRVSSPSPIRLKTAAIVAALLVVPSVFYWTTSLTISDHPATNVSGQASEMTRSGDLEASEQLALIVGDKGTILQTRNGHLWIAKRSGTTAKLLSVFIDMPESGWAGNGNVLLHTSDDGTHWETRDTRSLNLATIAVAMREASWEAGESAGATLKFHVDTTNDEYVSVAYVTPEIAFSVGDDGAIQRTDDSGKKWTEQHSGSDKQLMSVAFVNRESGWVVGKEGTILHTEDGGVNWKLQNSGTRRNLRGVAYTSTQSCWVVGEQGIVLHTKDGGTTWKKQQTGIRADLNDVSFTSELSGWIVGAYGTILHTTNGGSTWQSQPSPVQAELESITFARPWGSIGVQFGASTGEPAIAGKHATKGLVVQSVNPAGPAEKAGLKAGDTVTSLNGKTFNDVDELVRHIVALKPGTDATLGYNRRGKNMAVHVTLADRSKVFAADARPQPAASRQQ